MTEINMNQVRDRANKIDEISDEKWSLCLKENTELVNEFLDVNKQLSEKTRIQYTTCLKQFFYYVYTDMNNKPFYKITKRDFIKYMSFMQDRGLSSSAMGLRKSAVSSFCKYIENVVADDVEEYKIFRNFTSGMPATAKNYVYEKVAITKEEYDKIISVLEEEKDWLALAWVACAFNVGARRAELVQFKTEILYYPIKEGKNYIITHNIRGKGRGVTGKILQYMVNFDAIKYMKLWVDNRNFDSDYIFAINRSGSGNHLSDSWANDLCKNKLSLICGRRINPHLFKASCVTYLLEKGIDMKIVSKYIAHHEDVSTTSGFYDLRSFEEEKDQIF